MQLADWRDIASLVTSLFTIIVLLPAVLKLMQNVRKIEIATNSMKDALVASTATASHLEGEKQGRAAVVAEIAASDSSASDTAAAVVATAAQTAADLVATTAAAAKV